MLGMTRRGFIGTSAVIAGAAALGIGAERTFREYGPVDLKINFLPDEPISIKSSVYADEKSGRFGIRVLDKDSITREAWIPLDTVHLALSASEYRFCCSLHATERNGLRRPYPVTVYRHYEVGKRDDLVVLTGEKVPCWIGVKDVLRVVKADSEGRSA